MSQKCGNQWGKGLDLALFKCVKKNDLVFSMHDSGHNTNGTYAGHMSIQPRWPRSIYQFEPLDKTDVSSSTTHAHRVHRITTTVYWHMQTLTCAWSSDHLSLQFAFQFSFAHPEQQLILLKMRITMNDKWVIFLPQVFSPHVAELSLSSKIMLTQWRQAVRQLQKSGQWSVWCEIYGNSGYLQFMSSEV